ncbi:MAG: flagellar filament capping protein FliD [Myxococcota bacterium]
MDTTSLINAVLAASQVSIDTLNLRAQAYEAQKEAIAGMKNRMADLSTAIKAMDSADELVAFTATTASQQFSITAGTGAIPGSYGIRVEQLATAETSLSDGYDDKDASVLGTGTFDVTVGGVTTSLTIDGTNNSLQGLADALNDVSGVGAYVLDTGAAVGRYKLVVQGLDTGAANAITLDGSGLGAGTNPTFTETTTAVDAIVHIGGVQVQSASNTLSSAIPGVTLELLQEGTTADPATITRDTEATRTKLQAVVDAYNAIVEYYGQQTVYNPDEGLKGPLVGESSTRRALSDLGDLFTSPQTVVGTSFASLSQLGILTSQDGTLEFDTAVFDAAYEDDPAAVSTFLTDATGPLGKLATRIDDVYVDEDSGTLQSRIEGLEETVSDIEDQVLQAEARMVTQGEILRSKFTAMEIALSKVQAAQGYISALFVSSSSSTS